MGETVIEVEAARVIPAAGLPAPRREPRRRYPVKAAGLLCVLVPLLGGTLVLAGCQNQGASSNGERRDPTLSGTLSGTQIQTWPANGPVCGRGSAPQTSSGWRSSHVATTIPAESEC